VNRAELPYKVQVLPPWDTVLQLAGIIDKESWLLVGGLMTQAHAMLGKLGQWSSS
jgi:hypothetical protein